MVLPNNIGVIMIGLIAVVAALLAVLVIIEKKLKKKVVRNQGVRNIFYSQRIENINRESIKGSLTDLDKLARDFLNELFMIKRTADYSSLEKYFRQNNNTEIAEFCRMMKIALYSGKNNSESIGELIMGMKSIIGNNPIFTKEELERMEREKGGFLSRLKNIKISGVGKEEVNDK